MRRTRLNGLFVLLLIIIGNLAVWAWLNRPHSDVAWQGVIRSVSFAPYQKDDNPLEGRLPSVEEIDKDLQVLAGKVAAVRTYTSLQGFHQVPELAAKYGMTVTAGAIVNGVPPGAYAAAGGDENRIKELDNLQLRFLVENEQDINKVIQVARSPNVDRVIVGNEAVLTGKATVQQMIRYLERVREKVRQPVSTAEPWHVWIEHPELVNAVDFITIHTLPYWEGMGVNESLDYVIDRIADVKAAYPDKHIYIGEVGWPSAGKGRKQAEPSLVNQASFLRRFLNVAAYEDLDYNIIEAFDQPWKKESLDSGSVEAYWGLFDADRNQKFSWTDPVLEFKDWPLQAIAATFLAFLPLVIFVWRWENLRTMGKVFFAVLVQFAMSLIIWTMSVPMIKDFAPATEVMFSFLLPLQVMLLVVVLISGFELTELTWARSMKRKFLPFTPDTPARFPKVSLHLPICNEPPEMVKITLDSLARLDYPNFEVIVLDNNTKDPNVWRPVQEYCKQLGPHFRFFTLGKWPGFKSGALNYGLQVTAKDAEIVGVIDADYVVDKNWLRSLVPYFDNPKTGWVQAPQDHREWENDAFKEMINWEYAGFFHIGMVTRNEANAIIQHGTMTLIRKDPLIEKGGWAEWCICEDAELGLRLLADGYESVYVAHSFGHGLTPDSFQAYKKQRFRWAFGACQILKGHWRALMPFRKSGLDAAQKYHFIAGWLPWFADAFYLLFTLLSLVWTVGLVYDAVCAMPWMDAILPYKAQVCSTKPIFDFPLAMFVLPTVGVFLAKVVHHIFLYATRVRTTWRQTIGSAIAGMGLTYAIALAMWQGMYKKSTPFLRTPKAADKAALRAGFEMARDETILMLLQWAAALSVLFLYGRDDPDAVLWAIVLFVQSVPYGAALVTSMISVMPSGGLKALVKQLTAPKKTAPQ